MLFNGRKLIFTFSRTQVRIAEIERLQSLFKVSVVCVHSVRAPVRSPRLVAPFVHRLYRTSGQVRPRHAACTT